MDQKKIVQIIADAIVDSAKKEWLGAYLLATADSFSF